MSYSKINWQNKPSQQTPINATNLNHMDQGIADAHDAIGDLQGLNFAPIPVETVAGMTDHDKIYVYLGSETGYEANHWYYWNGTAWTEGGVYNAQALVTDPTLRNAGEAADAKATGDQITAIKSALSVLDYACTSSHTTATSDWALGAINVSDGEDTGNTNRIRTVKYYSSDDFYALLSTVGYEFLTFAYNKILGTYVGALHTDGTFSTSSSNLKWVKRFNLTDYPSYKFRFVLRDAVDPSTELHPSEGAPNVSYMVRLIDDTLSKKNIPADAEAVGKVKAQSLTNQTYILGGGINKQISMADFTAWVEKHSIYKDGTIIDNNDVIYLETYLDVTDYEIDGNICFYDATYNNGVFISCAFYDSNDDFIIRIGFVSGTRNLKIAIPDNSVTFRINVVYKINNVAVTGTKANVPLSEIYLISNAITRTNGCYFNSEESVKLLKPSLMEAKYDKKYTINGVGQGLTKASDYFVKSNSGSDSYDSGGDVEGSFYIYNSSFGHIGTISHNLGHASNMDYSAKYDVMLTANGNANVLPRLDILLNANSKIASAISHAEVEYAFGSSDVMSIFLTKNGVPLVDNADGAEWCFAGNDRIVIISVRDANKNRLFFKAILGVGSSDFSLDDNGYGTYLSGKSDDELNGTIKILARYTAISDAITSVQGMTYDKGELVVSHSTSRCYISRLAFYNDGYFVRKKLICSFYNADGTESSCEPEGIVRVDTDKFLCSTSKGVLEIEV